MRQSPQWRWHLDEVFVKINGKQHYLWRAVDHEGEVLEGYVTNRRDRKAALLFLKKSMKRYGNPEVIVTDRLASYRAAMKVLGNERRQEVGRHMNNRVENRHLPFRRRERAMLRFRQMRSLQKFTSVHSSVHNHFNHQRNIKQSTRFKGLRRRPSGMARTSCCIRRDLENSCWRLVRVRLTAPLKPIQKQVNQANHQKRYGECVHP